MNLRQRSRRKPIILSCLLALMALTTSPAQSAPAATDGIQLYKQAKYMQAAQALNTTIKSSKTANPTLYYYLGCCYYQLNQRESAKDIYRYIRNNFRFRKKRKMAGGMLAQLDTTPTANTTVAARPAAAGTSNTSRPTTEERSSQDLAEATKLLEALKQHGSADIVPRPKI